MTDAAIAPAAPSFSNDGRPPSLRPGDVHVWRLRLNQPAASIPQLRSVLNDDERRRADRFAFDEHRHHFTVGRAFLRTIVGLYARTDPSALRFCFNAYGKPELDPALNPDSIRFNLSHSGGLALYAISLRRELGVDVETVRPDFAGLDIARRFFSPAEFSVLESLDPSQRTAAFFACWTRKEAYIKARGKGLSIPLDAFEVSLAPGAPAALLATHDDPLELPRWDLFELTPGPGFAGALVVEGQGCAIHFADWPIPAE